MCPKAITKTYLRSFLGLCNYYRDFIPNYAEIGAPWTSATGSRQSNNLMWNTNMDDSFVKLNSKLPENPILTLPDLKKMFLSAV